MSKILEKIQSFPSAICLKDTIYASFLRERNMKFSFFRDCVTMRESPDPGSVSRVPQDRGGHRCTNKLRGHTDCA